jgi:transposase
MKRVIGMDIYRTLAEVVFWEDGRLRPRGRVDMTRSGLESFARGLTKDDEVVYNPAVKRLLTIAGVNATVAAGLVAAIGDVRRFSSPQKLVSYFGLNPRVRQSGLGLAQHGRISKSAVPMPGRCWSRRPLCGLLAAPLRGSDRWTPGHRWAAAKAPGPLHAFFVRIRARRGHQVAAVATARKMAVLVWHLLTKEADYLWARPALVAQKVRALELQAGRPAKKGNKRGAAYAYSVKEPRDREKAIAEQAERAYEQLVAGRRQKSSKRHTGPATAAGSSG